ncbi:nuclear transport factor 2 family protein [Pedobacter aquatilis]|uniref:nuclear transport factor 2 family protein n=1 Tax=Pedobacter aquatilis TaxID=351343 RepID=UPI00292FFD26|nr:nuclear transport factor 2 family protein [Pedobacter aquatilis]
MEVNEDPIALATRLEELRTKCMIAVDSERMIHFFSQNLCYAHSDGSVDDKKEFIKKIEDGTYQYNNIDFELTASNLVDQKILMISGFVTIDVVLSGTRKIMRSVYVAIYRIEENIWKFLSHQTGLIENLLIEQNEV